jgi:hypothetical protein
MAFPDQRLRTECAERTEETETERTEETETESAEEAETEGHRGN